MARDLGQSGQFSRRAADTCEILMIFNSETLGMEPCKFWDYKIIFVASLLSSLKRNSLRVVQFLMMTNKRGQFSESRKIFRVVCNFSWFV